MFTNLPNGMERKVKVVGEVEGGGSDTGGGGGGGIGKAGQGWWAGEMGAVRMSQWPA